MSEALLILGMMVVTFSVRYPVLALLGKVPLPPTVLSALKYIPVAVLTAIIVPEVLLREGQLNVSPTNGYLIAALAAVLISWRTKNLLLTIVLGMGTLWVWQAVVG
jgi:branched-subunit amino acid transport protein